MDPAKLCDDGCCIKADYKKKIDEPDLNLPLKTENSSKIYGAESGFNCRLVIDLDPVKSCYFLRLNKDIVLTWFVSIYRPNAWLPVDTVDRCLLITDSSS